MSTHGIIIEKLDHKDDERLKMGSNLVKTTKTYSNLINFLKEVGKSMGQRIL